MYKVMVVDDETWGRKSISKMISELALDVEIIAEAKNGQEALELIRMNKPHIVVTDMNMPIMNGEKFLENLHKLHGDIRVIVISGYSQFEYLKAALTYQASEYVLKPISLQELRNAMAKAIDACRDYMSLQQQKKIAKDILKLRREEFLQNLAGKRITNLSDIHNQAEELRIETANGTYRLGIFMFRQFNEVTKTKFHGNADLFMFSAENILAEVIRDENPLAFKSDDRMSIGLIFPESSYDMEQIVRCVSDFHDAVKRMLSTDVVAGISNVIAGFDRLPEANGAANDELHRNKLDFSGLSFSSAENPIAGTSAGILTSFDLKALGHAIGSGNVKDGRKLLAEFVQRVGKRPSTTIRDVHRELAKILEIAGTEAKGLAAAFPALFDGGQTAGILDFQQLEAFVAHLAEAISSHSVDNDQPESAHPIAQIVAFLDANYFEDVSLIDMATRFHMDPSYLSKLFKSVTDENFIEYVTRKRMEKACELLRSSDRKINEIAELVGYENQRYFSQVFKKFTGMTPSEYREAKSS
ncbi:response regulator transcription factor [Cohnella lupini]|uniref:Response regulator receiver domain-containing protein n=1 Tax=Cohnella lupini TaxID=1294267 RepID=A0A3D9IJ98_9BACL|nr:helix-turn-helix domain-containing protein [Cohnella lupini]RED61785.1 response regulator receiver domain-containing protein [Cohnella lupini]